MALSLLHPKIRNKCLEVLDHLPTIVNPLSVSIQSSGKKRLILDLRHVNLYIFKHKFKCEDLSITLKVMSKGYYLCKFDLKSGYHHVEIFPDHIKFLAFAWDFGDGVPKYHSIRGFDVWFVVSSVFV